MQYGSDEYLNRSTLKNFLPGLDFTSIVKQPTGTFETDFAYATGTGANFSGPIAVFPYTVDSTSVETIKTTSVPNFTTDDALKNPFSDGGVIGFSIIATGHSGADNYSAYTFYETYKMYLLTGDEFYLEAAKLLQNDTKLSTDYDGKVGYKYRAMMPEATNVSDFKFRPVDVATKKRCHI